MFMPADPSDKILFDENDDLIARETDLHILVHGALVAGKSSFIQTIAEYTSTIE